MTLREAVAVRRVMFWACITGGLVSWPVEWIWGRGSYPALVLMWWVIASFLGTAIFFVVETVVAWRARR